MNNPTPQDPAVCSVPLAKATPIQLIGIFAVVIGFGYLLSKVGLLRPDVAIGTSLGFGAVFVMGLVAASSSCVAVSGGLMLSTITQLHRTRSVLLFVAGRTIAYGVLGGLIGLLGRAFIPSPLVLGVITLAAALYMLITGLNMLEISPAWLKRLTPAPPRALTNTILNTDGTHKPLMPLLLGGATFFLPCGFTQTLQIYALTTGSFAISAMLLFGFALGTAPSLLLLGLASTSMKGKTGQWFYRFAGALVVVLGLWNIQNGLTIAGVSLSLPQAAEASQEDRDPLVFEDDGVQVIQLEITGLKPYYYPDDEFTVEVGRPVRFEIAGIGTGCRSVFQIPKFNVQKPLIEEFTVIEFTPNKVGDAVFSCSMGMFPGTLHVVEQS